MAPKEILDNEEEDDSKIFPQRLMGILGEERNQDAICWLPHGRAFIIRNRKLFAETVMPRYFSRKAKYSSFTRKLNRWNFVRVSSGPELGAYHHEFFLRDKPHLAAQMFCKNARTMLAMATSGSSSNSTGNDNGNNNKNSEAPVVAPVEEISVPQPPQEITTKIQPVAAAKIAAPVPQRPQGVPQQHSPPPPRQLQHQQRPSPSQQQDQGVFPSELLAAYCDKMGPENKANNEAAFAAVAPAYNSVNALQMLEQQMLFLQHQQEQAKRLFMEMQMQQQQLQQMALQQQQQQQRMPMDQQQHMQLQQQQHEMQLQMQQLHMDQKYPAVPPQPDKRVEKLRQIMDMRARQQRGRNPNNSRAHAA